MVERSNDGRREDRWDGPRLHTEALPNCAEDWVFYLRALQLGQAFFGKNDDGCTYDEIYRNDR